MPKIDFRPATRDAHYDRTSRQGVRPPQILISATDEDEQEVTSPRRAKDASKQRSARASVASSKKTGSRSDVSVKDPYSYLNASTLGSFGTGGEYNVQSDDVTSQALLLSTCCLRFRAPVRRGTATQALRAQTHHRKQCLSDARSCSAARNREAPGDVRKGMSSAPNPRDACIRATNWRTPNRHESQRTPVAPSQRHHLCSSRESRYDVTSANRDVIDIPQFLDCRMIRTRHRST